MNLQVTVIAPAVAIEISLQRVVVRQLVPLLQHTGISSPSLRNSGNRQDDKPSTVTFAADAPRANSVQCIQIIHISCKGQKHIFQWNIIL